MPLALSRNEAGGRKRCPIFAELLIAVQEPRIRDFIRYPRSLFLAPNISSVPEKPVFYTECLRKCVAYHRSLFCARHA